MIYLDSAATTLQKPPSVAWAVTKAMAEMASPGRGGHCPARRAAETVFSCRQAVAELFELELPEQVVFTQNATHALNLAIKSVVRRGNTVLISGYEHNAVTRTLAAIEGIRVKVAEAPLFEPKLFMQEFERLFTSDVDCVISTHVSNVFGYILPVEEMAVLCRKREVPFILDASQSAGSLPVSMKKLNAAFIAAPGHKGLYGPQGTGILLCGQPGKPLLFGGTGSVSLSQNMPDFLPDSLEAGTHNVCGIAGLLQGVRYVQRKGLEHILAHEQRLVRETAARLSEIRGTEVFSASNPEMQAGVLSFRMKGKDCEEIGDYLGRRGIAVRAGLHCAPAAHRSAGTLETGTVRISFSAFSERKDILKLTGILERYAENFV